MNITVIHAHCCGEGREKNLEEHKTLLSVYTNGKPLSYSLVAIAVSYSVIQLSSSPALVFSPLPPSDKMGQSKVTHIYPIIRGFEKTHIELQLMLQWGPESERCYRPKRLGFQGPANKRQSSPQRERVEGGEAWRV